MQRCTTYQGVRELGKGQHPKSSVFIGRPDTHHSNATAVCFSVCASCRVLEPSTVSTSRARPSVTCQEGNNKHTHTHNNTTAHQHNNTTTAQPHNSNQQQPTHQPTTNQPTDQPTNRPTNQPTTNQQPTINQLPTSNQPTTKQQQQQPQQPGSTGLCCIFGVTCSLSPVVDMSVHGDHDGGAAKRRRDRRLRMHWRHEQHAANGLGSSLSSQS